MLLQASAPRLSTFTAPELGSLVNALANLRFLPPPAYYAAVSAAVRARLPEMRPWELGLVINGLGRLAAVGGGGQAQYTVVDDETGGAFHPGFDLVAALAEAAAARLGEFDPQGLACLVNGLVNLGHEPPKEFVAGFVRCVVERMPFFNSQVKRGVGGRDTG